MRDLPTQFAEAKNKLEQDDAWLDLWQVDANASGTQKFCLVFYDEQVEFDGVKYAPFPLIAGEEEQGSSGELPKLAVTVSNLTRELMPDLEATRGFRGHTVRRIRVLKDHLDDPTAKLEAVYKIQDCTVDQDAVTFELGHENWLERPFASRRYTTRCGSPYKSGLCGYVGALPSCDKTLSGANGCVVHGNSQRFGGFPVQPV